MRAADRVAALTAIGYGVNEQLAAEKAEVIREAMDMNVRSFNTAFGPIIIQQSEPETIIRTDYDRFKEWAVDNLPDALETITVTRVKQDVYDEHVERLVVVGGDAVDPATGEVVPYATVVNKPAGDPYVTYPSSVPQKRWKAHAAALVNEQVQPLAETLLAIEAPE